MNNFTPTSSFDTAFAITHRQQHHLNIVMQTDACFPHQHELMLLSSSMPSEEETLCRSDDNNLQNVLQEN